MLIAQFSNEKLVDKIQRNAKNEVGFYKVEKNEKIFSDKSTFFKEVVLISSNDEFRIIKSGKTKLGKFEEYHQFYNGIPVKNGVFVLHRTGRNIKSANGNYIRVSDLNTVPSISGNDAKAIWCSYLNIPESEVPRFKTQLLVVDVFEQNKNAKKSQTVLAYKIRLYSKHSSNTLIGFVDAHSGEVCLTEPLALTFSLSKTDVDGTEVFNQITMTSLIPPPATGTFATRYSGSQSGTTESRDNLFFLEDWTRGNGIETLNLEDSNSAYTSGAVSFSDANNDWTSDEYYNDDSDDAALDVHWALQEIYDFFEDNYSRSGWDSTGQKINAYVHALIPTPSGLSRDNAAYFPEDDDEYLAFGDGQSTFNPVVSFDVVVHEYAHGINDHTSNLSGAFNEGLSDIWAATVEKNIVPLKSHWKIGEEIMRNDDDDCLRNIGNPSAPDAYTEIAHTFGTSEYYDNDDNIYYVSGIMSHWFYRLSEGGTSTNGLGNSYNVYGLGIEDAADLVYQAQAGRFLNGTTSYALMRTNMVNAADTLFGENSFQSLQVANAWYAVGVGSNPGQITISGSGLVCYSGTTFTTDCPPGSTISWSTSSNLIVQSGETTTTPTIRAKYSSSVGEGWVQANYTSKGYTSPGPRKTVWVGAPQIASINGPTSTPNNNWAYYTPVLESELSSATDYEWILNPINGNSVYDYGNYCDIAFYNPGSYQLLVRAKNNCSDPNFGPYYGTGIYVYETYSMMVSPNPATTEATISIVPSSFEDATLKSASTQPTLDENTEWDIEVYDNMQSLKLKKQKLKGSSTRINTQSWKEGVYMVRVKYNGEILTGKLIVKK